ncbi:MAG: hypothetical protein JWM34_4952 [Ilumatobacteraceae bacterium]|nr:hypothetical protein [Ilumatobacteraceae bacterium]
MLTVPRWLKMLMPPSPSLARIEFAAMVPGWALFADVNGCGSPFGQIVR